MTTLFFSNADFFCQPEYEIELTIPGQTFIKSINLNITVEILEADQIKSYDTKDKNKIYWQYF